MGNGAAAILTFFVPGLGQMCQGRVGLGVAALILVPFGYLLFIVPGLVAHLISIVDAATYKGR
ncbi:MAG: hypothetical protein CMK32_07720 [Porticoccaceae bacterium]|nr:hypothetical protein [Porticoccaceae bacterium]